MGFSIRARPISLFSKSSVQATGELKFSAESQKKSKGKDCKDNTQGQSSEVPAVFWYTHSQLGCPIASAAKERFHPYFIHKASPTIRWTKIFTKCLIKRSANYSSQVNVRSSTVFPPFLFAQPNIAGWNPAPRKSEIECWIQRWVLPGPMTKSAPDSFATAARKGLLIAIALAWSDMQMKSGWAQMWGFVFFVCLQFLPTRECMKG